MHSKLKHTRKFFLPYEVSPHSDPNKHWQLLSWCKMFSIVLYLIPTHNFEGIFGFLIHSCCPFEWDWSALALNSFRNCLLAAITDQAQAKLSSKVAFIVIIISSLFPHFFLLRNQVSTFNFIIRIRFTLYSSLRWKLCPQISSNHEH